MEESTIVLHDNFDKNKSLCRLSKIAPMLVKEQLSTCPVWIKANGIHDPYVFKYIHIYLQSNILGPLRSVKELILEQIHKATAVLVTNSDHRLPIATVTND